MTTIRVDIDRETERRLLEESLAQRRPVRLHAEVLLRQALGLAFPIRATDADAASGEADAAETGSRHDLT